MTLINILDKQRTKRIKRTAEVFTPDDLACEMLAKLPKEIWQPGKTICDPACGNGQFLIWALINKLRLKHKPVEALKTLYGVDIIQLNVAECKMRLLKTLQMWGVQVTEEHVRVVYRNIAFARLDVYPRGSLDYDFEFDHEIQQGRIDEFMKCFNDRNFDDVFIKVPDHEAQIKMMKKWFV